ncbi:hypothetical protein Zmor_021464 [Zophobas morio]|uniref:Endothelin-converting enzyme 1 n=1 Tax=Zophobas morio TaxID=2755281 RepID=A0AA38I5M4_9CUCU|nr:hypothetical protein Zmor_021464 [Zophobas morio]
MKEYKRTCCAKRSILEKILIVVIVLLLCLLIALFSVFVFYLQNGKSDKSPFRYKAVPSALEYNHASFITPSPVTGNNGTAICMTHHCIQAASQIIDFLDTTIDPCDDFYSFVCGNFLRKSAATNEITPLSKFEGITLNQLDALITEPIEGTLPKSWELQRKYYKMCMDVNAIEKDDTTTFSNLIQQLGDWPVLHGRFWDERKFNWLTSMIQCRKIGFAYEHFMGISANAANDTRILLTITPPAVIHLPYQLRELYIDIMANISIDMGAPSYLAKNEFIRVYKFEEELKALVQDENENGRETIVTVSKLQSDFPTIPWKYFLNELTQTAIRFDDDTLVRLRASRYLLNLLNLIERTPKSTQANYVVWKIIENFRSYLKESIRGRYESFLITLNPDYAFMSNRHVFCLNKAKFYFPSVAELAYVRRYLQPEKRKNVKGMTATIKAQMINKIRKTDWLDRISKNVSINKVSAVDEHIGSSDEAYGNDFDKVVDMDEFDLYTDNIMEMATKLYAKRADNYFKIVNQDPEIVTKEALTKSPVLSINAFYNKDFNTLVVPAPFLQGVIYNFHRPQYMNYGALGSVIGHEFTHAFVAHKNKSESGEIHWSPDAIRHYEEKIQCLLEDYQQYSGHLKEFTKDAKSALEENIADLVGPNLAYSAYQERVRVRGQEPTLPSLPYTQNQIFWIMSGAFRCYQPKLQPKLRFDQEHAVPSFAVISSMRNSPSFAADFNCPAGSNMNPEKKCQIL